MPSLIAVTSRSILIYACLAFVFTATAHASDRNLFSPLKAPLLAQGFEASTVDSWLGSSKLKFQTRMMVAMLAISEYKRDYAQFLSKSSVRSCKKFMKKYRTLLKRAEQNSKVPPEVVTAIVKIESNLGSYQGKWLVFNMLASMAVVDTKPAQNKLKANWPKSQMKTWEQEKHYQRLARKAAWAKDELAWLGQLADLQGRSPFAYKGSGAGAMGMGQFVPSSVLKWGADGNSDGKLQMHHPADAIASVANYLAAHGWKPGLTTAQKIEVLFSYNRSRPYAETVLNLAEKL